MGSEKEYSENPDDAQVRDKAKTDALYKKKYHEIKEDIEERRNEQAQKGLNKSIKNLKRNRRREKYIRKAKKKKKEEINIQITDKSKD